MENEINERVRKTATTWYVTADLQQSLATQYSVQLSYSALETELETTGSDAQLTAHNLGQTDLVFGL